MNIKAFLAMSDEDYIRQMRMYIERNLKYATSEDHLRNSRIIHEICKLWNIKPAERPEDVEWFFLISKLTRDRQEPQQDNLDDAPNYIRRILSWRIAK